MTLVAIAEIVEIIIYKISLFLVTVDLGWVSITQKYTL